MCKIDFTNIYPQHFPLIERGWEKILLAVNQCGILWRCTILRLLSLSFSLSVSVCERDWINNLLSVVLFLNFHRLREIILELTLMNYNLNQGNGTIQTGLVMVDKCRLQRMKNRWHKDLLYSQDYNFIKVVLQGA